MMMTVRKIFLTATAFCAVTAVAVLQAQADEGGNGNHYGWSKGGDSGWGKGGYSGHGGGHSDKGGGGGGGHGGSKGAPGPIAGAGLPILLAAGGYAWVRRYRNRRRDDAFLQA